LRQLRRQKFSRWTGVVRKKTLVAKSAYGATSRHQES
jgi:hypothetical protein